MSKYAVEVTDVKKSFFLPHHKNNSLKQAITQSFKPKAKGGKTFNALDGISFNVEKGDFFGILGRNGSGKSTLLKIISEIYQPTSGSVKHDGKLVSFIELGVGFKPELSGRENVFLNGGLLGFSKKEVEAMYDEIVSFAELEPFMDQKLKNYSSGMKVRLAFSVAIRAKADILILDEVLAVGDAAFRKKFSNYFKTLKENHKTVILVTHSMGDVREYCNKAIVIDGGKIIYEGDAEGAAMQYLGLFETASDKSLLDTNNYKPVNIEGMLLSVDSDKSTVLFDIEFTPSKTINDPILALVIHKGREQVYRWVSDECTKETIKLKGGVKFSANLCLQNIFPVGEYKVSFMIRNTDRSVDYAVYEDIARLKVNNYTEHKYNVFWKPEENFTVKKD